MNDRTTILNLLDTYASKHKNISWKMKCCYSDGMGTSISEISILQQPGNRNIGTFAFRVETGTVLYCRHIQLKKSSSENIVDMLLDLINYSKDV